MIRLRPSGFGVVLYEMLTGKQLFGGETVSDTLAATLKEQPDFEKVPAKMRPLLRSCLEKNPSRRLRDVGDAWRLIEGAPESLSVKHPWMPWCLAAVLLIAFLVLLLVYFRKPEQEASEPVQFQITPTIRPSPLGSFALSPDGRHLAFAGFGTDGAVCLWLRSLSSLEARPLPRTESNILPPFFWSPDSRYIVFDSGGKLKKIDISGGLPQPICDLSTTILGGSWNSDGVIILGNLAGGLMRVSSTGGTLSVLTRLQAQESQHSFPAFLPDGKHFFYFCNSSNREKAGIYEGSLGVGPEKQSYRKIAPSDRGMAYVPSRDDSAAFLLYLRGQTLMAQPFDDHRLTMLGESVPLVEMVATYGTFYPLFSVSTKGVLAYLNGVPGQLSRATWFDRQGKAQGTIGEPGSFYGLALSPDATKVAAGLANKSGQTDLWMLDLTRENPTRFTFALRSLNVSPLWSPDGSRIVFSSSSEAILYKLYHKSSSGAGNEEPLHSDESNYYAASRPN